jgi:hypothetical protein
MVLGSANVSFYSLTTDFWVTHSHDHATNKLSRTSQGEVNIFSQVLLYIVGPSGLWGGKGCPAHLPRNDCLHINMSKIGEGDVGSGGGGHGGEGSQVRQREWIRNEGWNGMGWNGR